MRPFLPAAILVLATGLAGSALAQTQPDHQQHRSGGGANTEAQPAPQAQPPSPGQPQTAQPMQAMPEQCRAMMQNMPQGCMGMMQGGMMQGGMMGQGGMMQGQPSRTATQSEATKAYMAAMDKMHGPMVEAVQAGDPDVAFVRGMIPHHQGAIDMAKVRLQYGKDEQTKKWANDVIRDQQREIDEMQAWLKTNAK
jgi:hypothetical protein